MMTAPAAQPLWRLEVTVPQHAVPAFETVFEGISVAVTSIGDDDIPWRVEGYTDAEPDTAAIEAGLAIAADALGIEVPGLSVEFLTPRDWLAENMATFAPLRLGRFFIYPSHYDGPLPAACIPFRIDAGTAFGSGTHPTTGTCLAALADLAKSKTVTNAFDLGCGSGILAFAIAKLWPAQVLAADIDPEAVRVTHANTRDNGLRHRIQAVRSTGYLSDAVRRSLPFDLIVANVLARPLIGMAAETARHLAPGGTVVLSGLLDRDARWVASRHRAHGLVFVGKWQRDGWSTLVMRKPG
ncbi:MAG: 50S ribosomal protein L11 methyltransferase [Rhodospirillales bacterium]|nr:50S ribosomal protein L11 methyltransferase [Rhodospirillales bacterium]MBO6788410.1 50S ribosomal protein L11 methyltransferase [Rhodospirillales bacterium]